MFRIFDMLIFAGVLFFLGWIFLAATPEQRMDRACAPISWGGQLVEAGGELATSPHSGTVHTIREYTDKGVYGCQYIIWRAFYAHPDQLESDPDEPGSEEPA